MTVETWRYLMEACSTQSHGGGTSGRRGKEGSGGARMETRSKSEANRLTFWASRIFSVSLCEHVWIPDYSEVQCPSD